MKHQRLPELPSLETISERLRLIFPMGTERRNYLIRDIAVKTIFVMFYTGAVESRGQWMRPNQVTRMTDAQAAAASDEDREAWTVKSLRPTDEHVPDRWYQPDTREPIRDETIRFGLIPVGAVIERPDLPTTSSRPRYALADDFAALFTCRKNDLDEQVALWQKKHLTRGARARMKLLQQGTVVRAGDDRISITFPNGETRLMSPGPSSLISKAVIEEFAPRFLGGPGVIFLSESRRKVIARDDELARGIGLNILPDKLLPDIVLVDLAPQTPLLVFVEVVATDGPVSAGRKADLLKLAMDAGYDACDVAFVTALMDRGSAVFRKVSSEIAWGSLVWFVAEPDHVIWYQDAVEVRYLHQITAPPGERSAG